MTSPSSSPVKANEIIALTGKVVYFCSITVNSKFQYTKIILENKLENEFSYIILRIIDKQKRTIIFHRLENIKKKTTVMIKIDKPFMEDSLQNGSLNTFGESYMNKVTRTLRVKMKTYTTYTLDVSNYDSKRKLIVGIIDPELTQTYNLHKFDAIQ